MCNLFTDVVLQTLVEEYSDFCESKTSSDDGHELRMKLGEVLVRVTGMLGKFLSAPQMYTFFFKYFVISHKCSIDMMC